MIVSFAWTSPALLAGQKTCTRREWDPNYAAKFRAGRLVQAWDQSPRFRGRPVADVRLTADAYWEPIILMPDTDYQAEGFEWLHAHPGVLSAKRFGTFSREDFENWRDSAVKVWVIRFELVTIHETLEAWLARRGRKVGAAP